MKNILYAAGAACLLLAGGVGATPQEDMEGFRTWYQERFPSVPLEEYVNGTYAIDADSREQWEAYEEFPPYELDIEEGQQLFETPFANGKSYADCFENGGIGIRQNYPYFDTETGQVKTLEQEINECRVENGEQPLPWKKGALARISAYMAYTSRDKPFNIVVPDDPRAKAAYEAGKQFFYTKRGQLNFSCATCHMDGSGRRLRAEILSPALGHVTHFPVYRVKWGEIGTLHRRYEGCVTDTRSETFKPQSEEFRNLEYFHTYMSNGLTLNGPGVRK